MGESEMGRRVGLRRVVATNVGLKRRRFHYVVGDIGGRYVHTLCGKSMTQVRLYGGNGVEPCAACAKVASDDRQG